MDGWMDSLGRAAGDLFPVSSGWKNSFVDCSFFFYFVCLKEKRLLFLKGSFFSSLVSFERREVKGEWRDSGSQIDR